MATGLSMMPGFWYPPEAEDKGCSSSWDKDPVSQRWCDLITAKTTLPRACTYLKRSRNVTILPAAKVIGIVHQANRRLCVWNARASYMQRMRAQVPSFIGTLRENTLNESGLVTNET